MNSKMKPNEIEAHIELALDGSAGLTLVEIHNTFEAYSANPRLIDSCAQNMMRRGVIVKIPDTKKFKLSEPPESGSSESP